MTLHKYSRLLCCALALTGALATTAAVFPPHETPYVRRQNAVVIIVDDLKPALGVYGDSAAITPNMDRLLSRGTFFTNAHAQKAECAPSRVSMLTSRRNDDLHVWRFEPKFRKYNPNTLTLPGLLRRAGYRTYSFGKVFDYRSFTSRAVFSRLDYCSANKSHWWKCSWSREYGAWNLKNEPWLCTNRSPFPNHPNIDELRNENNGGEKPIVWFPENAKDSQFTDGCYVDLAIDALNNEISNEWSSQQRPFFMMLGLHLPHLPFVAPKKYWDMHSSNEDLRQKMQKPRNQWFSSTDFWKRNKLKEGHTRYDSHEFRMYDSFRKTKSKDLIRAYYASVSFVDALIGRVLHTLDALDFGKDTSVFLVSDHGYHLSDRGMWGKKTVYDMASRVPFGFRASETIREHFSNVHAVRSSNSPVELVDLFPTVVDLLKVPALKYVKEDSLIEFGPQGLSLLPLADGSKNYTKAGAISQYESHNRKFNKNLMAYTIRTLKHRFVAWTRFDARCYRQYKCRASLKKPKSATKRVKLPSAELYEYDDDSSSNNFEQLNVYRRKGVAREYFRESWSKRSINWDFMKNAEPFDRT